jgi:hypothetical protein
LSRRQQQALADPLLLSLRQSFRQLKTGKGRGGEFNLGSQESAEVWRLLGSLELLDVNLKIELGDMLADLLSRRKTEGIRPAIAWALGRLGARLPLYGPLNTVVPVEGAARWLRQVLKADYHAPMGQLAAMQMSRKTGDRYRDLPEDLRRNTVQWLEGNAAPAHFVTLVRDGGTLDEEEQGLVFGEALPRGLRILESS